MIEKKILITKKFEFSASHRYWREEWTTEKNEEIFGLCTSPHGHGHNYELHVSVLGEVDLKTGMIINLTNLKKYVNLVVEKFDHKYLNLDTPFFQTKIPTTENIALVLFDQIDQELKGKGAFKLYRIRLYERSDLYVDIYGEKP
jgi:6-pyruvoyltetrahydropterin/6-carboxytetrahydropterin synthase